MEVIKIEEEITETTTKLEDSSLVPCILCQGDEISTHPFIELLILHAQYLHCCFSIFPICDSGKVSPAGNASNSRLSCSLTFFHILSPCLFWMYSAMFWRSSPYIFGLSIGVLFLCFL